MVTKMKGAVGIQNKLQEIIVALNEAGHVEVATNLKRMGSNFEAAPKNITLLKEIGGLRQIRALGDLNMPKFDGWDWPNQVGKLGDKCRNLIGRVENGA